MREWRKRDYQKPVLERAALIAAARKQDWKKLPDILAYLSRTDREEIADRLPGPAAGRLPRRRQWPVLRNLMADPSPLVRASAAEALGQRLDRAQHRGAVPRRPATITAWCACAPPPRWRRSRRRACPRTSVPGCAPPLPSLMDSMKSRPDDMASHYNLGNFYLARSQMPEAAAEFETACRLQPDALPPRVNVALAYNALGQNDKAEASLRQALSLDPTNAAANLNLGMLLAEMGKMSGGRASLPRRIQGRPQVRPGRLQSRRVALERPTPRKR